MMRIRQVMLIGFALMLTLTGVSAAAEQGIRDEQQGLAEVTHEQCYKMNHLKGESIHEHINKGT